MLALARLEADDWKWSGRAGSERGVYVDSEMSAWGTVLERIHGSDKIDQTESIRGISARSRDPHATQVHNLWRLALKVLVTLQSIVLKVFHEP